MSYAIEACVLCGSEVVERRMRLVEWVEPGNQRYAHIPTCVDRVACRERVERVLGEAWPLNDRTPAPAGTRGEGSARETVEPAGPDPTSLAMRTGSGETDAEDPSWLA